MAPRFTQIAKAKPPQQTVSTKTHGWYRTIGLRQRYGTFGFWVYKYAPSVPRLPKERTIPRVWRGVGSYGDQKFEREGGDTAVEYLGILSDARYAVPLPLGYPRGKREPQRPRSKPVWR